MEKEELNYKFLEEQIIERLKTAHNPEISKIRKKFFEKEYDFFKKNIKDKNVLVAGSGLGHDCIELAKNNKKVVGVDILPKVVQLAKEEIDKSNLKNISIEKGDFKKLKYGNKIFDVAVLNMGTISDFDDKEKEIILKELLRVSDVVFFDFYLSDKKSLENRKPMYEEEGWHNVRIKDSSIISDDGLISHSTKKEKIINIAKKIKAKVEFFPLNDFSLIAKLQI